MKCPKCGGKQGYEAHDYFSGWAPFLGDWDKPDEESPAFNDKVVLRRESKTAICLDCGKRVKRPLYRKWPLREGEMGND